MWWRPDALCLKGIPYLYQTTKTASADRSMHQGPCTPVLQCSKVFANERLQRWPGARRLAWAEWAARKGLSQHQLSGGPYCDPGHVYRQLEAGLARSEGLFRSQHGQTARILAISVTRQLCSWDVAGRRVRTCWRPAGRVDGVQGVHPEILPHHHSVRKAGLADVTSGAS